MSDILVSMFQNKLIGEGYYNIKFDELLDDGPYVYIYKFLGERDSVMEIEVHVNKLLDKIMVYERFLGEIGSKSVFLVSWELSYFE